MSSFTHSATTSADLLTTWNALQQGETWVGIGGVSEIGQVTHADGALRGFMFKALIAGRSHPGAARVTRSEEPNLMEIEIASRDISGSILTRLTEAPDGTNITVTLTAQPRSMIVRLAFGAVSAAIQNGLPRQVQQFAAGINP